MILEQHYLSCLAQASYLVGDKSAGEAFVVDPRRDIDVYVDQAKELGVRITGVLLTHVHADFLGGHLELAERSGAAIHVGAGASVEYPHQPLQDGDELRVGAVKIKVLSTPGHTPESVCYVVYDGAGSEPHAVLTGDTLFLGDVGRPDLLAGAGHTREGLAGMMYESLRTKLLPLPDGTLVYPGHGAGSACGKNLSSDTFSTLGEQRRSNYALQPMDKEAFVAAVTDGLQPPPAYFPMTSGLNRSMRPILRDVEQAAQRELSLDEVLAAQAAGATILDTRNAEVFAAGHLKGSLFVGLEGNFASWAGQVLDLHADVVLVSEPGDEGQAVRRLGRIGFDRVRGHLAGGAAAFAGRDELQASIGRRDVAEAQNDLASGAAPLVLDVRQPGEVSSSSIESRLSIPLGALASRLSEVPRDRPLLVHCKAGYRSMIASSILAAAGIPSQDLRGGFDAWTDAGAPVVEGASCG